MESGYYSGGYGYGAGGFQALTNVGAIDQVCNWMFIPPGQAGDSILFGSTKRFSGVHIVLANRSIKYDDLSAPPGPTLDPGYVYDETPPPYAWIPEGRPYNDRFPTDGGDGGVYVWEYWTGSTWATLTVSDTTEVVGNPFAVDGFVSWEIPVSTTGVYTVWPKDINVIYNIPNPPDGLERYWVRCRVAVPPTTMPEVDYVGIVYAGLTNRGNYCATDDMALSALHQPLSYTRIGVYNPPGGTPARVPPFRDANNIYVYGLSSWSKPDYESGLQEILDRLKTAGTVAIINPPT